MNSTRRVLCCRYRQGADTTRASNDAGATARLDVWTGRSSARDPKLPTYWPEGRRRDRAGGRQEYRHLPCLAQPYALCRQLATSVGTPVRRTSWYRGTAFGTRLDSLDMHLAANFVPSPYV